MSADPIERAVAEWRAAYPEDDDLPDEAVGRLLLVRQRAFGIALIDLGHALRDALVKDWPRLLAFLVVAWLLVLAASLLWRG